MSKSLKKIVEESRDKNLLEVEMCDRGISNMLDVPALFTLSNITQLVLSHNKLTGNSSCCPLCTHTAGPQPQQAHSWSSATTSSQVTLPAVLCALTQLVLSHNKLTGNSSCCPLCTHTAGPQPQQAHSWSSATTSSQVTLPAVLCALTQLVLSHNKLTAVPANISELKNLEVLNMFNNQIEELPTQISSLQKLKHLNLGMNRLSSLPRGFGNLDLTGPKQVFKAENNPWVTPIADQFQLGVSHVFEYFRSETYK
ncbi:hypothetical protein PAMA_008879 [Pampus argenteus]